MKHLAALGPELRKPLFRSQDLGRIFLTYILTSYCLWETSKRDMIKTYLNYVQNVLGAKAIQLPIFGIEAVVESSFHFAVAPLNEETKIILTNIAKALNIKKFDILEIKSDAVKKQVSNEDSSPDLSSTEKPELSTFNKSNLIIFGIDCAQFLMPHLNLELGKMDSISGSQVLLTYSLEEMLTRPELKRDAWQHLKFFKVVL